MIFEFIQHLYMKLDESKPFREIFYPDLYAEAGEGDLAEYADAAPEQDDDDIGGGMEKRSSRAHALRVRSGAAFHALRHNTNYLCRIRMQHAFCIRSAIIPAALDTRDRPKPVSAEIFCRISNRIFCRNRIFPRLQ